jgi:hypothetical protein
VCVLRLSIVSFLILVSSAAGAQGAQTLGSQSAVVNVLKQSRGDVLLALIDSPSDRSKPLKTLQGFLSLYSLELNGIDLGQFRRNNVLYVTPRLGLNRLKIRDVFDKTQEIELTFPAMRSMGVPTSIVELQTSRQFDSIRALTLSRRDVQAIGKALDLSQHGGMTRVLNLIRSRGKEMPVPKPKPFKWGGGAAHFDQSDNDSGSDSIASEAYKAATSDVTDSGAVASDAPQTEADQTESNESTESAKEKSSFGVSADRRSYY